MRSTSWLFNLFQSICGTVQRKYFYMTNFNHILLHPLILLVFVLKISFSFYVTADSLKLGYAITVIIYGFFFDFFFNNS